MLLPTTSLFEGSKLIGIPETVIAGPPGRRSVLWIARPEGLAVKVASLTVRIEDARVDSYAE